MHYRILQCILTHFGLNNSLFQLLFLSTVFSSACQLIKVQCISIKWSTVYSSAFQISIVSSYALQFLYTMQFGHQYNINAVRYISSQGNLLETIGLIVEQCISGYKLLFQAFQGKTATMLISSNKSHYSAITLAAASYCLSSQISRHGTTLW